MDLRSNVKQALRMCGHAVVSTIHDRLNQIELWLQEILDQNTQLASTQTALLQSGLHVVDALARIEKEFEADAHAAAQIHQKSAEVLAALTAGLAELQTTVQFANDFARIDRNIEDAEKRILEELRERLRSRIQPHDEDPVLATVREGVEKMLHVGQAVAGSLAVLEPAARETSEFLATQSVRQVCVEASDYLAANPELGLLEFLYSHVPSRKMLDIGAHVGDVSEHLLKTGYEVYAFEPYPESYRRLVGRLEKFAAFHAFPVALGSASGELPLYLVENHTTTGLYGDPTLYLSLARHGMPEDLSFAGAVNVTVKRLAELHADGLVPSDVGIVKIDAEGFDLEVIRGMQDYRYPVVLAEFWDVHIPFATKGLLYTVETLAAEMRNRGYLWYIVIYRVWGAAQTSFFCNHDRPVPGSWGNVIFFRQRDLFVEAQNWCSAVLPRTYFKPSPVEPQR